MTWLHNHVAEPLFMDSGGYAKWGRQSRFQEFARALFSRNAQEPQVTSGYEDCTQERPRERREVTLEKFEVVQIELPVTA